MIFNDLVLQVKAHLGLTSGAADVNIGRSINRRYRRVTSAVGLGTSRHSRVSGTVTSRTSEVVFSNLEKIERVINENREPYEVLEEVLYEEIRNLNPESNDSTRPYKWAVKSMTANEITVALDRTASSAFKLYAEGLGTTGDLSGSKEPNFPSSFHDILIDGAIADELRRERLYKEARDHEQMFEVRLSDLKMFLAKSAYKEIYQGKYSDGNTRSGLLKL